MYPDRYAVCTAFRIGEAFNANQMNEHQSVVNANAPTIQPPMATPVDNELLSTTGYLDASIHRFFGDVWPQAMGDCTSQLKKKNELQ